MEYIFGGRRYGKTIKALEWVRQAERTNHYPFWDRVLLVHDLNEAQKLRIQLRQEAEARGEEDSGIYYNLVYSTQEWATAHLGQSPVKVMVDNAERLIGMLLHRAIGRGELVGWTWNIDKDDKVTLLTVDKSHLDRLAGMGDLNA